MREKILSFFSFISDTVWNLFPSTPLAYIAYLAGISFFCVFMIYYLAYRNKNKKTKRKTSSKKELTMGDLLKIADNPKSSTADLLSALMLFHENFTVSQDKNRSFEFFEKVLNHKNRNKPLFDFFHGNILPANIKYKDELDKIEKKALNK